MAKRRTKKDKLQAKHTYQLGSWYGNETKPTVMVDVDETAKVGMGRQTALLTAEALYGYDSGLIVSDLIRTVVISLVVLVAELGLYYWWM